MLDIATAKNLVIKVYPEYFIEKTYTGSFGTESLIGFTISDSKNPFRTKFIVVFSDKSVRCIDGSAGAIIKSSLTEV